MSMDMTPMALEGRYFRLEPLSHDHLDGLIRVVSDGALWNLRVTGVPSPDEMPDWIDRNVSLTSDGQQITYVTVYKPSDEIVGTSSLLYPDSANRTIEIGRTWLASSWQRTPANTETKYLLLCHAFELMGCVRVQFLTDAINEPSRAALVRIGATLEGVIRYHRIKADGRNRNSACYSVIEPEWPSVKTALQARIARPYSREVRSE